MPVSGGTRWLLRIGSAITLAFLYLPLIVIAIYAFNPTRVAGVAADGFSTEWFSKAFDNPGVRDALLDERPGRRSPRRRSRSMLGTLAAYALARFDFFGKESISFLVILPIALPGHRHRHGAERDVHAGPARRPRALDGRRRATRRSASSSSSTTSSRGCGARRRRSRRRRADLGARARARVPRHHVPADALGADRRRAARVRAELRRGDRHDVHRRAAPRRCRSGSSTNLVAPPNSCRSSTSSRSSSSCSRSSPCTSRSACRTTRSPRPAPCTTSRPSPGTDLAERRGPRQLPLRRCAEPRSGRAATHAPTGRGRRSRRSAAPPPCPRRSRGSGPRSAAPARSSRSR